MYNVLEMWQASTYLRLSTGLWYLIADVLEIPQSYTKSLIYSNWCRISFWYWPVLCCNFSYDGPTFMDMLPWEDVLYKYVLPRLTLPELFGLRCCSRQANTCVDQYFTCCRCLNLVHVSARVTPATFRLMTPGNACLQQMILRNCKWLTDTLVVPVVDPAHLLHTLDLSNCTGLGNASLQKVAISCPNLAVLLLRDCHWVSTDGMLVITLHCRNLTRLDITACWEIDDDTVITLAKMCDKWVP